MNPQLSFRFELSIMLCGSRQRSTSTGSPARKHKPTFCPAFPSLPELGPSGPSLSFRIYLSIMLCGSRQRSTSTGRPALNNKPTFWPALASPPELGSIRSRIVVQNRDVHHGVRFLSAQHFHREPCSEYKATFWVPYPSPLI